ncbi:putative sodium-dependent transporter [Saliniradius amylolyticus]|uniref:Transporter n=1 Tax=Saliniradius amylolyticus TaxID=2183582 RepID=A0A2S2E6A9_9ALTE|nr:sodium-dependent transporter [Saliniradius amylolyticus]AWL13181.1 putative sodium-dependent transporter [Saliniradius amylolyticus]
MSANSNAPQWSSQFAFLMASIGTAVGLANIWRFPYTTGTNGGGAFVLIYIGAAFAIAMPVLIAELMVGRRGKQSPPQAISSVANESKASGLWRHMGNMGVVGALLVLSFYAIVGGWTMAYVPKLLSGELAGASAQMVSDSFDALQASATTVLTWHIAFLVLVVFISCAGLASGVERLVKLVMPLLFVMLVLLVIYAANIGDFSAALDFLFTPDFSKITPAVTLEAIGQAFFSISVGLTNLMVYGAYMQRKTHIPRSAAVIVTADTIVALLAGLAIFPIIFAFGLDPNAGPGLVFVSLPVAFAQMDAGNILGAIFFLLLFFAALTSAICMLEVPTSWLQNHTRLSRRQASFLAGVVAWALGILSALSFNLLSDVYPLTIIPLFADMTFFALFDYLTANIAMPLGGILVVMFVGWAMKTEYSSEELCISEHTLGFQLWLWTSRVIAPVALAWVFISRL